MRSDAIKNRYEFVVLFDCINGNPNGDPDAGNLPRTDAETGLGYVTDVCLKRKIRNYVDIVKDPDEGKDISDDEQGYKIYIKSGTTLNEKDTTAYKYLGAADAKTVKDMKKKDPNIDVKIKDFMCRNFYDIRTFGAVMTTFTKDALNCGQVRGPVQISFARSIDPVFPENLSITRCVVSTEKDAADGKNNTFGQKAMIPYGLYRAEGYISANLAQKVTGFSEADLELLWEAIINMFEHDHAAARGQMAVRKLIIFKHSTELGDCPAHKLLEAVKVVKHEDVTYPRNFSDYDVYIDKEAIPESVEVIKKL